MFKHSWFTISAWLLHVVNLFKFASAVAKFSKTSTTMDQANLGNPTFRYVGKNLDRDEHNNIKTLRDGTPCHTVHYAVTLPPLCDEQQANSVDKQQKDTTCSDKSI